jgi:hypothetical protein
MQATPLPALGDSRLPSIACPDSTLWALVAGLHERSRQHRVDPGAARDQPKLKTVA